MQSMEGIKPGGPRLMSTGEAIAATGLSSARIYQLIDEDKFPLPIAKLKVGRIWLAEDIEAWIEGRKKAQ